MSLITIKVNASLSPEYMFEKGKEAGLSDKAVNYFRYFEEVPLELTVNTDTGEVTNFEAI